MVRGDVLVLELLSLLFGPIKALRERVAEVWLSAAADLGEAFDRRNESRLKRLDRRAGSFEEGPAHAILLANERKQKMFWLHRLGARLACHLRSLLQSLLGLFRESVQPHVTSYAKSFRPPNAFSVCRLHVFLAPCLSCPSWKRFGSELHRGSRES